jgi:signal transduction histidine kinase
MNADTKSANSGPGPGVPTSGLPDDETLFRVRLLRWILWAILGVGSVLVLLRLDRGLVVLGPTLVLFGLAGLALLLLRRDVRWLLPCGLAVLLSFTAATVYWIATWNRGGLPPAIVYGVSSCLLFTYAVGERLGWLALLLFLGRGVYCVVMRQPIAPREWDVIVGIAITACALEAIAWAHMRVHHATAQRLAAHTADLTRESALRTSLVCTLLEEIEAPLRDPAFSDRPSSERARALLAGLRSARETRASMPALPEIPTEPATTSHLLVPFIAIGILGSLGIGVQGMLGAAPNAAIGFVVALMLALLALLAWRFRRATRYVAAVTLLCIGGGMIADALVVPPGLLPSGLVFAPAAIAFSALWLGMRASIIVSLLMAAAAVHAAFGRTPRLDASGTAIVLNLGADTFVMTLLVAPTSAWLGERLARVQARRQELAASLRTRRRLLGTLFHDAANHVTALVGLFELEAAGLADETDLARAARVQHKLARLVASARHWLFADAPFEREQLSAVALPALGQEMTDLFADRLRAKSITLVQNLPDDLRVLCVPELLSDGVIGNLLSNAVKFSKPGDTIELVGRATGSLLEISVRDRGPGIPPTLLDGLRSGRDLPSLPGTRGETGQGLGLSLATEHVRRMGGCLDFALREGGGTEARVTLPSA